MAVLHGNLPLLNAVLKIDETLQDRKNLDGTTMFQHMGLFPVAFRDAFRISQYVFREMKTNMYLDYGAFEDRTQYLSDDGSDDDDDVD